MRARFEEVGRFSQPVHVSAPLGDPRLFVVEKGGRIQVLAPDGRRTLFLDISDQVTTGYEQGLLSMAFAPDYAATGLFYVDYTDRSGDTRVVEYRARRDDVNRADESTRRELLFVDQPFPNHNGGLLLFDRSGMLLIGLGDGGSGGDPGNRAQDLGELLGKLLRIDPRRPSQGRPYGIPGDNPFVSLQGARPEVWAYGLRNPWRFSFDASGDLYVGDVGQNRFEELDVVAARDAPGANYGWRAFEGDIPFSGERLDERRLVRPVLTYPLSGGACSIVAGGVYRGKVASLRGLFLFADFCIGQVRAIQVSGGRVVAEHSPGLQAPQLASFGEDAGGEMYVASLSGAVLRIVG